MTEHRPLLGAIATGYGALQMKSHQLGVPSHCITVSMHNTWEAARGREETVG